MYYKLLNKNVITVALVSLMTLGVSTVCEAQGVVSLVEEEAVVLPKDKAATATKENLDDFSLGIDAEIPDVLPETDEIIPLDNKGLISPAPTTKKEAPAKPKVDNKEAQPKTEAKDVKAPAKKAATPAPTSTQNKKVDANSEVKPAQNFDLGLPKAVVDNAKKPAAKANNTQKNKSDKKNKKAAPKEMFANSILSKVDNELFTQMSDIEKQTTLLTLELRREKLRNEVEAVKAQRTKAEEEKLAEQEAKKLKEFEWKKEQEAKVYKEQQKLKEKEIELEKLRQRKALNAYMNKMLVDKQSWIKENAELLKKLEEVEKNRDEIATNFQKKLDALTTQSNKLIQSANDAKNNHDRTIASLTAQNIQLKKRIEADTAAANKAQQNLYDSSVKDGSSPNANFENETPINISQEYAILDISGKGKDLVAKLINKEGNSFTAQRGTVLQSGFTVDEITNSYIQFSRYGSKQYLYTNGYIEPEMIEDNHKGSNKKPSSAPKESSSTQGLGDKTAPSLGSGMFVK